MSSVPKMRTFIYANAGNVALWLLAWGSVVAWEREGEGGGGEERERRGRGAEEILPSTLKMAFVHTSCCPLIPNCGHYQKEEKHTQVSGTFQMGKKRTVQKMSQSFPSLSFRREGRP